MSFTPNKPWKGVALAASLFCMRDREKQKAYRAAYNIENREKIAAGLKRYAADNKEKIASAKKAYRQKHKAACAASEKAWRDAHKLERAAYQAEYRHSNRERLKARQLAYRQANREKASARASEWAAANKDRKSAYLAAYTAANDEKVRAWRRNYRLRKQKAEGRCGLDELIVIREQQRGRCAYCGTSIMDHYEVDHVIPLSKGGSNWPENIVLTCRRCNRRKSAMLPERWAAKQAMERRRAH